jgi:hypothetical protein
MKALSFTLSACLLMLALWPQAAPAQSDAATEEALRQAQEDLRAAATRVAELHRLHPEQQARIRSAIAAFGRPMLGVVLQDDPQAGVRLAAITPDSPAEHAGLRSGDRLLAVDGRAISAASPSERLLDARRAIGRPVDGQEMRLDIERDGKRSSHSVTARALPGFSAGIAPSIEQLLEQLPPLIHPGFEFAIGMVAPFSACPPAEPDCQLTIAALRWRGLRMARVEPELGRYFGVESGVLVLAVDRDQLAPLRPGDVLLEVDGIAVHDPDAVMRALQGRAVGEPVPLTVQREHRAQPLEIAAPAFSRLPAPPAPPRPPAPPQPPRPAPAPLP